MGEQFQTANVKLCLKKIEELIKALEQEESGESLKGKRDLARKALDQLRTIFGYETEVIRSINCRSHPFFD